MERKVEVVKVSELRVAVVGPCVSGKSELVDALRQSGYEARHVAQEHSYVPAMWERISKPDVLIFLDVDYTAAKARRPNITWGPERLEEQAGRLRHAREHCDLYVNTSEISVEEVWERVLRFLEGMNFSYTESRGEGTEEHGEG